MQLIEAQPVVAICCRDPQERVKTGMWGYKIVDQNLEKKEEEGKIEKQKIEQVTKAMVADTHCFYATYLSPCLAVCSLD